MQQASSDAEGAFAGGQSRPPLHALSLRASAHTGAAIRSQRGAAALTGGRGRRPLQSIAGTNVRLAAGHMGPALQSAARSGRTESSAPADGYWRRFIRGGGTAESAAKRTTHCIITS